MTATEPSRPRRRRARVALAVVTLVAIAGGAGCTDDDASSPDAGPTSSTPFDAGGTLPTVPGTEQPDDAGPSTTVAAGDYTLLCAVLGEVDAIEDETSTRLAELDEALRALGLPTADDLAATQREQVQLIADFDRRQVELLDEALVLPPPPELIPDITLLRDAKVNMLAALDPVLLEAAEAPDAATISAAMAELMGGAVMLENGVRAVQAQFALDPFTAAECGFRFEAG